MKNSQLSNYFLKERANVVDKDGDSALMIAVMNGNEEIVQLLLGREDIEVNATDSSGRTSLMLAVSPLGKGESELLNASSNTRALISM